MLACWRSCGSTCPERRLASQMSPIADLMRLADEELLSEMGRAEQSRAVRGRSRKSARAGFKEADLSETSFRGRTGLQRVNEEERVALAASDRGGW